MNIIKLFLLICISIMFLGCMKVSDFSDTIEIDAPSSVVFFVITDYESYDKILPELHDSISIVSEKKKGPGVAWESTGSYKGHSFTTIWTVTGFIQDEFVTMEDLKDGIGSTTLTTKDISQNKTEYNMQISIKMFSPFEEEFFEIYREEMKLIKAESERLYQISASSNN